MRPHPRSGRVSVHINVDSCHTTVGKNTSLSSRRCRYSICTRITCHIHGPKNSWTWLKKVTWDTKYKNCYKVVSSRENMVKSSVEINFFENKTKWQKITWRNRYPANTRGPPTATRTLSGERALVLLRVEGESSSLEVGEGWDVPPQVGQRKHQRRKNTQWKNNWVGLHTGCNFYYATNVETKK